MKSNKIKSNELCYLKYTAAFYCALINFALIYLYATANRLCPHHLNFNLTCHPPNLQDQHGQHIKTVMRTQDRR